MSSCYQSYKVSLTNFCHSKIFIFRKLYAGMMNIFGRSSSRRQSLGESSSDSSARRSYVEPSESSTRDAATKTCLWPCDEYMVRVGIKEEFEQYVHNAGLSPYLSDKCVQHQLLTESFVKGFKYFPRESRVSFLLYDNPYTIPLENFAYHCKLPFWGSLDEPPMVEFESCLRTIHFSLNNAKY